MQCSLTAFWKPILARMVTFWLANSLSIEHGRDSVRILVIPFRGMDRQSMRLRQDEEDFDVLPGFLSWLLLMFPLIYTL